MLLNSTKAVVSVSEPVMLMVMEVSFVREPLASVGLTNVMVGVRLSKAVIVPRISILGKLRLFPESVTLNPLSLNAVFMLFGVIAYPKWSLWNCCRRAAAPAACGVAIEVPLLEVVPPV